MKSEIKFYQNTKLLHPWRLSNDWTFVDRIVFLWHHKVVGNFYDICALTMSMNAVLVGAYSFYVPKMWHLFLGKLYLLCTVSVLCTVLKWARSAPCFSGMKRPKVFIDLIACGKSFHILLATTTNEWPKTLLRYTGKLKLLVLCDEPYCSNEDKYDECCVCMILNKNFNCWRVAESFKFRPTILHCKSATLFLRPTPWTYRRHALYTLIQNFSKMLQIPNMQTLVNIISSFNIVSPSFAFLHQPLKFFTNLRHFFTKLQHFFYQAFDIAKKC
jgi:hypothetical protein